MNKQVFIINGSGGVGKDTFVELVSRYVGCRNFSSVEEVKHFAEKMIKKGDKILWNIQKYYNVINVVR